MSIQFDAGFYDHDGVYFSRIDIGFGEPSTECASGVLRRVVRTAAGEVEVPRERWHHVLGRVQRAYDNGRRRQFERRYPGRPWPGL